MRFSPVGRRGAMVVIVAFSLGLFLALIALVVDGGRLHQRKGRIQCCADLAAWSALAATRDVKGSEAQVERARAVVKRLCARNGLPEGSLKLVKPRILQGRLARLTVVGRLDVPKLMPYGPKGLRAVQGVAEARLVGESVALRRPED